MCDRKKKKSDAAHVSPDCFSPAQRQITVRGRNLRSVQANSTGDAYSYFNRCALTRYMTLTGFTLSYTPQSSDTYPDEGGVIPAVIVSIALRRELPPSAVEPVELIMLYEGLNLNAIGFGNIFTVARGEIREIGQPGYRLAVILDPTSAPLRRGTVAISANVQVTELPVRKAARSGSLKPRPRHDHVAGEMKKAEVKRVAAELDAKQKGKLSFASVAARRGRRAPNPKLQKTTTRGSPAPLFWVPPPSRIMFDDTLREPIFQHPPVAFV